MSLDVISQEGRAVREKIKEINLELKNILLLSVDEDRPLTIEEVEKILKLNKDHRNAILQFFEFIIENLDALS